MQREMPLGSLKQNTTETLFALGDLPQAKGSRSGAHSPHTLEMEGKQSRAVLSGWNIWPHHLTSPSLPLWVWIFNREFRVCIPGCRSTDSTAEPYKGVKCSTSTTSIPTHGAKLLRIQEVHCNEVNDRCTEKAKNSLILGLFTFLQRWFCLWVQLTYICRLQNL